MLRRSRWDFAFRVGGAVSSVGSKSGSFRAFMAVVGLRLELKLDEFGLGLGLELEGGVLILLELLVWSALVVAIIVDGDVLYYTLVGWEGKFC